MEYDKWGDGDWVEGKEVEGGKGVRESQYDKVRVSRESDNKSN